MMFLWAVVFRPAAAPSQKVRRPLPLHETRRLQPECVFSQPAAALSLELYSIGNSVAVNFHSTFTAVTGFLLNSF